jgi:uncharacterized membrane-anchored protein
VEHSNERRIAKAVLVGWSVLFFLYTLLGVWVGTGPDALAGPSTLKDDILAGIWLSFSIVQLVIAIILHKHYKPWLFWVAVIFAILSTCTIFGPLLALYLQV